jgi:hypothetical protein
MSARTRVGRWSPPFGQAIRLALRPAIAYVVFCLLGSVALLGTITYYDRSNSAKDILLMALGLTAGMVGIVLGQLIGILRFRAIPTFLLTGLSIAAAMYMVFAVRTSGSGDELLYIIIPVFFFLFAFPCGLLSLQHRWELFATFWPAVGFIGSVIEIVNREGRLAAWSEEKAKVWLPVPLVFLAVFILLWLFYLASKQAMRVELWQSLSGAAARRVSKKETVSALPRKNILPIFVLAGMLFVSTALLAPYLWRTVIGDKDGGSGEPEKDKGKEKDKERKPPEIDGDALMQQMKKLGEAGKQAALHLWPLLLLALFYRPAKRAFLTSHLKSPIFPAPPSERIDNLWEYIRIAAEDGGVMPTPSDSVEQLMKRIHDSGKSSPALARAAEIYVRTRYGFTVGRGDAMTMRTHAIEASKELKKDLSPITRVKNLWRPLS